MQHKEWVTSTTLQSIRISKGKKTAMNNSLTKVAKVSAQKQYNKAYREVKRSLGADERGSIDSLARQAEVATQGKACTTSPGRWQEDSTRQTNQPKTNRESLWLHSKNNSEDGQSTSLNC